jgi:hypothetical protein
MFISCFSTVKFNMEGDNIQGVRDEYNTYWVCHAVSQIIHVFSPCVLSVANHSSLNCSLSAICLDALEIGDQTLQIYKSGTGLSKNIFHRAVVNPVFCSMRDIYPNEIHECNYLRASIMSILFAKSIGDKDQEIKTKWD